MYSDTEIYPFEILNGETGETVELAMEGLWLTGRILPVGARLVAVHTFRSAERKPLEVVYAFGLPRDAALRRFRIVGQDFQVRSELKPVREAQQEYEKGVSEGHLSALARTYRDGRINLSVGNIRPGEMVKVYLELVAGVEVRDDGLRFRFPFTLAPCYHAQARAVAVEPGVGEQELPGKEFGDLLLPRYLSDTKNLHGVGFDLSVALGEKIAAISSPSHAVRLSDLGTGAARVSLSVDKDVPNRDLVLDVRAGEAKPCVCGGIRPDGKGHFSVVIPSGQFGKSRDGSKSVIFILDRSGSMHGLPIEQAKKALTACLATLSNRDSFGLIAFDDHVETFNNRLQDATSESRRQALQFLNSVDARGGTELAQAIEAGIKMARGTRSDLFVVTDGQVSATENIIGEFKAAALRIHCLGIGAASQDRFLTLLARETGGFSRFLNPRERVDMGALELFASLGNALASKMNFAFSGLTGAHAVLEPPTALYEGQPAVVMAEAAGAGSGVLEVSWGEGLDKKKLHIPINLNPIADAEIVGLLQGARLITDLDAQLSGEVGRHDREQKRLEAKLEQLSKTYGLASRVMALVAVIERAGDDATKVPTTRVVPVGMPQDVEMEAYFSGAMACCAVSAAPPPATTRFFLQASRGSAQLAEMCVMDASESHPAIHHASLARRLCESVGLMQPASKRDPLDLLMERAGDLLQDGGLPGGNDEERLFKSAVLLLCFLSFGHTCKTGAFRVHAQRLAGFLRGNLPNASSEQREFLEKLVAKAENGDALPALPAADTLLVMCATGSHKVSWDELRQVAVLA